jgi:hypothetical protein
VLGFVSIGGVFYSFAVFWEYPFPQSVFYFLIEELFSLGLGYLAINLGRPWYNDVRESYRLEKLAKETPEPPPPPPPPTPEERHAKNLEEVQRSKAPQFIEELPDSKRPFHVWMPGVPGQGKSTLMLSMARYDMFYGLEHFHGPVEKDLAEFMARPKRGVTVIDPAGDLVNKLIHWVPPERVGDTIYFDFDHPVPIDFLSCETERQKETIVANIRALFETFSERTGSQVGTVIESVLTPLVYTLLDAKDVSFLDIHHFLTNEQRRAEILSQPSIRPELKEHWRNARLTAQETAPIVRRMAPLVWNPSLQTIFGHRNARLKISDVLYGKKILLVNLAGGERENVKIVASLIIAKLQQAVFSQPPPESERIYHALYADEFQTYQVSSDFTEMLSQARKFRLCLTLANQWFDQITEDIFNGLLGIQNWYMFQLQFKDANLFKQAGLRVREKELYEREDAFTQALRRHLPGESFTSVREVVKPFDVTELTYLKQFTAIHRKATDPVKRVVTPRWDQIGESPLSHADLIKKLTLETYGVPPQESSHPQQQKVEFKDRPDWE